MSFFMNNPGYVAVRDKKKAVALEKYFKTGSGRAILEKRILGYV